VHVDGTPHVLGVPAPPHVFGWLHVPHESSPPQPSATGPQFAPALAHVLGVHGGAPH
jgi:hypothetical protein